MTSSFTVGAALNYAGATLIQDAAAQLRQQIANKTWENRQAMPSASALSGSSQWASGYGSVWGDGPPYPEHLYFSGLLNNEVEVFPTGDAIRALGSVPFTLDSSRNILIKPRPLNSTEKAILSKTGINNAATFKRAKLASGAFCSYPFSLTPPYAVKMNCKVPIKQGTWPALWLLPVSGAWPPELDVFEMLNPTGSNFQFTTSIHTNDATWPAKVKGTSYVGSNSATQNLPVAGIDFANTFHEYVVIHYPDFIAIAYDGKVVKVWPAPSDFNQPWYVEVDYAVGGAGDWAGTPPDLTADLGAMTIQTLECWKFPSTYGQGTQPTPVPIPTPTPTPTADVSTARTKLQVAQAAIADALAALG